MNTLEKLLAAYVQSLQRLFQFYRRMLKKNPFLTLVAVVAYITMLVSLFIPRPPLSSYWNRITGRQELETRILELQEQLDRKDEIIDTLTKRTRASSVQKDLTFEETWETEENRANVLRLLDYADFAIEKEDYSYAERVYREASQIQETLSVHYYLGRLYHLQGDLTDSEVEWKRAIELDPQRRYPEVRFYLAILLYEMGNEKESTNFLEEYLRLINLSVQQ